MAIIKLKHLSDSKGERRKEGIRMKKKQNELIQYLSRQNRTVKSTELANVLQISARSVKNYVSEINLLYDKKIILSSRQGYQINRQISYNLLLNENSDSTLPQTGEERAFYIIKQLILEHTSSLNLFDLCDYLCISYSTIKSVIGKMNKTFSAYHVEFICKNNCVQIVGSEKDKRRLISYIINEESNARFLDIQQLGECFCNIDVESLHKTLFSTFKKHNYYLNDFAAVNILLQLLILIDRNLAGNELNVGETVLSIENQTEFLLLQELFEQLENQFLLHLNPYEKFEIHMLIKANATSSLPTSKTELKKLIGNEFLSLTDYYVAQVNNHYLIDLSDERFTAPFTLHLENLILRAKLGRFTSNPLAESIKLNNPIIFDIAIYIGLDLMERYNLSINEDEIAFLAIHIGAEIERQNMSLTKIRTVLLCPNYRNISTELLNNLLFNFGNQLDIIGNVYAENDLKNLSFSLLLTTVPLNQPYNCDVVQISPFNLNTQYNMIYNTILKRQDTNKNKTLRTNFHTFFESDLFLINPKLNNREQILHYLCEILKQKEYVDKDFESSVLKRENAATTAFGNIAIPHSVDMNAVKTSVSVAISKSGFQWGGNTVYVVFLLAINKADKTTFRELYESLASLFGDENIILEIRKCNSFKDFEQLIYNHTSPPKTI